MRTREAAFTLIELLVTMGVIGVLSAIAVPQYSEYRARAFDARSLSVLRNAATAEESYFANTGEYVSCSGGAQCETVLPEFRSSDDVIIEMTRVPAGVGSPEYFLGLTFHPAGDRNSAFNGYEWDSSQGGLR